MLKTAGMYNRLNCCALSLKVGMKLKYRGVFFNRGEQPEGGNTKGTEQLLRAFLLSCLRLFSAVKKNTLN